MKNKGFTRIELMIVIGIVIILAVSAIPVYKKYFNKALYSEGRALLSSIQTAEKIYYKEFGNFHEVPVATSVDQILDIDARGNKIFTQFAVKVSNKRDPKTYEATTTGIYRHKEITLTIRGVESSDKIEIVEMI